jgi:hypothetical protein
MVEDPPNPDDQPLLLLLLLLLLNLAPLLVQTPGSGVRVPYTLAAHCVG